MPSQTQLEELVEKYGGYDNLSEEERKVYTSHLETLQGKQMTIDDVKNFVRQVIIQLEKVFVDAPEGSIESLGIKGRLKNMLVMESYLFSADRARKALEHYYANHKDLKA